MIIAGSVPDFVEANTAMRILNWVLRASLVTWVASSSLLQAQVKAGQSAGVASPATAAPVARMMAVSHPAQEAVDAADRDAADKALDAGRHPAEMLSFFGIMPGMRVGEIAATGGYTTELLVRTVGPQGKVYGQNSQEILDKFAQAPWTARLAKPVNKNVVRLDRPFEAPFPAEVKDLDAVLDVLFYHDTVWLKADRKKMNAAIFAALKHGGVYGIIDHTARDGAGLTEAQTLHRIEEKTLREEVEQAGFKLAAEASFLRNPADPKDWSTSPRVAGPKRGSSDRFVLKFVKP